MHQIIVRHRFGRLTRLPPRRQPAHDHERIESLFPQQMRHPGAGRFPRSSAVQINIFVFGQLFQFFRQMVGLETD
jgi:hypothetical protein